MKIILVVENNVTYIKGGKLPSHIYQSLKKELGYYHPNAFFMIKNRKGWDGLISTLCIGGKRCKCYIRKDGPHFPTGLFRKAYKFLLQYDELQITVKDSRPIIDDIANLQLSDCFEPREYQVECINNAVNTERGLIKMATGGGKTPTSAGMIVQAGVLPVIFYVPSQDLLAQTKNEFEKFILSDGNPADVGVIGAGKCDIKSINVMTIQTAVRALGKKYKKFDDEDCSHEKDMPEHYEEIKKLIMSAKCIILDECQHAASETVQLISDASINANYKWGMSATPYRDLSDDILIEACFGKTIADINASYLIDQGYLVQPEICFVPINNMNNTKYSSYAKIYENCLVYNEYRNNIIAHIANVLQEDNRITLVLCKHIAHGEILEDLIPGSVFLNGSHTSAERENHLNKIREGKSCVTIATSIFDEGINVKPLDSLILAGSGKSYTRALQRVGRILRPYKDKQNALVYDFQDGCKYLKKHSNKRRKIYSTEPNFIIKDMEL